VAVSGNEIWVAAGIYYPTELIDPCDPRTATFQMINGLAIYGGFPDIGDPDMADRDPNLYETILSGDLLGNDKPDTPVEDLIDDPCRADNCYHVFYHPDGTDLDPNAMLDGFTITAGNADAYGDNRYGGGMYNEGSSPTVTNCTFTENSAGYNDYPTGNGGGMYNEDSSPIVKGCTFTGNIATRMGGGMLNFESSSPIIDNCTFTGNSAEFSGGGMLNGVSSSPTVTNCTFTGNSAWDGGGMKNGGGSPTVTNCTFTANSGGGLNNSGGSPTVTNCTFTGNSGGGMRNGGSSPTVTNCTFTGNSAGEGGGMYNDRSSPTVTNCTFTGNSADYGGGMVNFENNPTVTNCTFIGNSAEISGGGMANSSHSSPTLTNCTFNGNRADDGGGIYNEWTSSPTVTNCILWANTASDDNEIYNFYESTPVISYCDIAGCGYSGAGWDTALGYDGGGNIDADPYFVDIGYWDPNNTPDNPNDDFWVNGDYHLLPGSPCIDAGDNSVVDANIPDLDGYPRIMNDVVDMGAYEFLPAMEVDVHILPRVINRNNRVKRIIAIIHLPAGIGKGDVVRESFELYADGLDGEPVGAILERVIGWGNITRVFVLFDKAELIDLVSRNGPVELTVTGKLVSGRCISGSDTIRINQPTRRRPRWRRR
jgi:hypothetical protein